MPYTTHPHALRALAGLTMGLWETPSPAGTHLQAQIVWQRYPHPTDRAYGLAFTHAPLNSLVFGPIKPVPGTTDTPFSGGLQGQLKRRMAVNSSGKIAMAQSRFRPGRHSDIRLIHGQVEADE